MITSAPLQPIPSKKKLFSIKGALDLIDHDTAERDLEELKETRMKLSKQEEDMMNAVKSKMRYAGETYHRVAPAKIELNLLKGKR